MHSPTHARLCALPMLWFIHTDTLLSDGKAYPMVARGVILPCVSFDLSSQKLELWLKLGALCTC